MNFTIDGNQLIYSGPINVSGSSSGTMTFFSMDPGNQPQIKYPEQYKYPEQEQQKYGKSLALVCVSNLSNLLCVSNPKTTLPPSWPYLNATGQAAFVADLQARLAKYLQHPAQHGPKLKAARTALRLAQEAMAT